MSLLTNMQQELKMCYGPRDPYSRVGAREELEEEGGTIPWIYMSMTRPGRSPTLVIGPNDGAIPLLACCYSPGPVHYVSREAKQPREVLKRYGVHVMQGDIERDWSPPEDVEVYGFVVMYRVLEQFMFNPLRTLSYVHRLMAPGSQLALATAPSTPGAQLEDLPFFDPVDYSYSEPAWYKSGPRLYSPNAVVEMLENTGFEIEEVHSGRRLTHILSAR